LSQSSGNVIYRAVRDSSLEYFLLLGLWMLYVSQTQTNEVLAGVAAALIAAVADAVLKAEDFAKFDPRWEWLLLIVLAFAYAMRATWEVMRALARNVLGKKSQARFKAVNFHVGGDDGRSWARRTLVAVYLTIPANSIVIGIDRERQLILEHEIAPAGTPEIAKQLGAK
jgi:multisubunit Na+/H+ antiporter MnhE subunit